MLGILSCRLIFDTQNTHISNQLRQTICSCNNSTQHFGAMFTSLNENKLINKYVALVKEKLSQHLLTTYKTKLQHTFF